MLVVEQIVAGYSMMPAIHGISFEVKKGQIVALLGSNGSGKSTTFRAITGAIKTTSGSVTYKGKKISGTPIYDIVKLGISMVPEGRQLFPKMSIYDNLLMGAYIIKDKNVVKENLEKAYELFPILYERKTQLAGTLSGGEQQMVAIARALMSNPELLILDEPSLGIMPKLVDQIFEEILKIRKNGITVLMAEQNAEKTLSFADYAYVLSEGEVAMQGSGEELLKNDQVQKVYLGM